MGTQRGLTLIELMIVAACLAIVTGLAVSSLAGAVESARAESVRGDLVGSLNQALSHAALTGTRAVLCPTIDGQHCSDGPDWSGGWLVFMDSNASRELEGGERVLRREEHLPGHVRLHTTAGRTRIVFQGYAGNGGSNVSFTLCDGRGPARAQGLVLANFGRLRAAAPSSANLAATCVR
jgi:type IV fimbrial biogenesis protein FimT